MKRSNIVKLLAILGSLVLTARMPAQSPITPCTFTVPGYTDREWRVVRADGFTFCIPATWEPKGKGRGDIGAKEWKGDGGTIGWGTGLFRERGAAAEGRPMVVATVRADQLASPSDAPPAGRSDAIKETIDGRAAELWTFESRGRHQTRVQWLGPAGYLRGDAVDDEGVRLHFAIFRTVRFEAK